MKSFCRQGATNWYFNSLDSNCNPAGRYSRHFREVNVTLKTQVTMLQTVTVKAGDEDPAYTIMRKAIAKAKYHLQQLDSYSARVYIRVQDSKGLSVAGETNAGKGRTLKKAEFLSPIDQRHKIYPFRENSKKKVISYGAMERQHNNRQIPISRKLL